MTDILVKDARGALAWFSLQPGLKPKLEGAQLHH